MTPRSLVLVRDELCLPWGYIYVLGAQQYVKVGMTKFSIYRRWHQMRTSNPWLEPPLYVSPPLMDRVNDAERMCHAVLAEFRVTGEWFDCPRELAIDMVQEVIRDETREKPEGR